MFDVMLKFFLLVQLVVVLIGEICLQIVFDYGIIYIGMFSLLIVYQVDVMLMLWVKLGVVYLFVFVNNLKYCGLEEFIEDIKVIIVWLLKEEQEKVLF